VSQWGLSHRFLAVDGLRLNFRLCCGVLYEFKFLERVNSACLSSIGVDDGSMSGHAHTDAAQGLKLGAKVTEGNTIGNSDGSGTGNAFHQYYTYREGATNNPATKSTSKVNPMKTQFKNMSKQEVCVKGSGGC